MRHRHGLRKLNKTSSHRLAMLRNMTVSLLKHEAIRTTLPKAKELRRVAEPIITLGKNPTLSNKRMAFDRLRDRDMVVKLFGELGPRYAQRPTPASSLRTLLLSNALPFVASLPQPCAGARKAVPGRADAKVEFVMAATHAPTLPRRCR